MVNDGGLLEGVCGVYPGVWTLEFDEMPVEGYHNYMKPLKGGCLSVAEPTI